MAYISQEKKKALEPKIKEINKKYGVKARLSIRHHSSLVLNISSGKIDFIKNYNENTIDSQKEESIQVNPYYFKEHFSGEARDYLREVIEVMNTDNYDNSDRQTDYFDVGHYVDVNVGKWDKPYKVTAE